MKFEIKSSVELKKVNAAYDRVYEFSTPEDAINFLDISLHSDEYIEGTVKVKITKG